MEQESHTSGRCIGELHRIALCLLSVGLACAVFLLIWGKRLPASGILHSRYREFVAILLTMLIVAMILVLRKRMEGSAWPLLIGAMLGYFSASVTYIIHVLLIHPAALVALARSLSTVDMVLFVISVPPLSTLSWLLGALSGAFFVLSRYMVLRRHHATIPHKSP
jgi:hypothetical protein